MCGIIFVRSTSKDKKIVNETALDIFENQRKRGTEGFGIVKIFADKTFKVDRATEGYKFMWDIHQDPVEMIMVHHRIPTSTPNLTGQTHPMFVSNGSLKYDYLIIHNGMINNDDELKKEHEALGFVYQTEMKENWNGVIKFNDSEALATELARYIEGQEKKYRTIGGAAFIVLQIDKKKQKVLRVYFGRHGSSPLKMAKTRGMIMLASENIGDDIKEDIMYSFELDEKMELTKKNIVIEKEKEDDVRTTPYNQYNQKTFGFSGTSANDEVTKKYNEKLKEINNRKRYDYYDDDGISDSYTPNTKEVGDDAPDMILAETEQDKITMEVLENINDIVDGAITEIERDPTDEMAIKTWADMVYDELKRLQRKTLNMRQDIKMEEAQKEYEKEKMLESNLADR